MTSPASYPSYLASGNQWLGDIPSHWAIRRLMHGFELVRRPPQPSDGNVTAYRDGQVTLRSNRRIDGYTEADKEIGYQGIRRGDLVIHAMDAFAGAIGVSESDGKGSPVYSVCRSRPGNDPAYAARVLRHIALSGYITSLGKGVRERSTDFRWNDARNMIMPVPPLDEQRQIAAYLDRETGKIDELIAKQEQLVTTLTERRQAVITQAVTRGLDPTVDLRIATAPWIQRVPTHWRVGQVKHIGTVSLGKMIQPDQRGPADFKAPYMRAANVQPDGATSLDDVKEMWFTSDDHAALNLLAGDVVVVEGGVGGYGRAAYLDSDLSGWGFQNSINRVRMTSGDGRYLAYALISARGAGYIEAVCAAVSMPHFTAEKLGRFPIPIPPEAEQRDIADHLDRVLDSLDALVTKSREVIVSLRERRQALISAAVTGKIDVRGL